MPCAGGKPVLRLNQLVISSSDLLLLMYTLSGYSLPLLDPEILREDLSVFSLE